MLLNPSKFRDEVIDNWDVRVAGHVVEKENHTLTGDLAAYVEQYDFSAFGYITIEEMLDAHRQTAFWAQRFGGLLPPPAPGNAPDEMMPHETVYVGKLLEVYAETAGASITDVSDLDGHAEWKDDLQRQRVRFFNAEAFVATYRDQTEPGTTEDFADQILEAIEPSLMVKRTGLERLTNALTVAGLTTPASVLSPQAKIGVKHGVCQISQSRPVGNAYHCRVSIPLPGLRSTATPPWVGRSRFSQSVHQLERYPNGLNRLGDSRIDCARSRTATTRRSPSVAGTAGRRR